MSQFSHYEPCPRCRERGKDSRGDNLGMYRSGHGHCWSCGYHRFPRHYVPQVKEIPSGSESVLPPDFTREVPADAWKWLFQYGLGYSYWKDSCGYSEKEGRLVFTVGDPIAFSIGRLIREPEEGANHAKRRKWYVWGNSHKHSEVVGQGDPTVLVEDLVSAHKVGQITTCIPLFGVEPHPCHIYTLRNGSTSPVVLWLDQDQGGSSQKKARRLESLINRTVLVKQTVLDPKCLNFEQIKQELKI